MNHHTTSQFFNNNNNLKNLNNIIKSISINLCLNWIVSLSFTHTYIWVIIIIQYVILPHFINSLLYIYILYMIKSLPEHRSTYCPRTAQSVLFPQSWPPVPQCRCLGHRTWYQPGTQSAGKPGCSQSSCCWLYTTGILWLSQIKDNSYCQKHLAWESICDCVGVLVTIFKIFLDNVCAKIVWLLYTIM